MIDEQDYWKIKTIVYCNVNQCEDFRNSVSVIMLEAMLEIITIVKGHVQRWKF